jgi:hypothetical protein
MDLLSNMITKALRSVPRGRTLSPTEQQLLTTVMREVLVDLGIFARDMERTDVVHRGDGGRQMLEREAAAERLYARLLEPPCADSVVPLPTGMVRFYLEEGAQS